MRNGRFSGVRKRATGAMKTRNKMRDSISLVTAPGTSPHAHISMITAYNWDFAQFIRGVEVWPLNFLLLQ
jgi:hypothetical protein